MWMSTNVSSWFLIELHHSVWFLAIIHLPVSFIACLLWSSLNRCWADYVCDYYCLCVNASISILIQLNKRTNALHTKVPFKSLKIEERTGNPTSRNRIRLKLKRPRNMNEQKLLKFTAVKWINRFSLEKMHFVVNGFLFIIRHTIYCFSPWQIMRHTSWRAWMHSITFHWHGTKWPTLDLSLF